MKCSKCGKEFEGKFCPECGTPSVAQAEQPTPVPPVYQQPMNTYQNPVPPQKKKSGCLKGGLIALGVLVVLSIVVAAINGKGSSTTVSASSNAPASSSAALASAPHKSAPSSAAASSASASSEAASDKAEAATITKAEFDQIKTGMTYAQVVKIVGGEGSLLSESEVGGIKTAMYMWYGEDGISNANIMVQNNKLVSKTQIGLE